MPSDNSQERQRWAFRPTSPLLPLAQCVNADAQCLGERFLAQPHKAAQGGYVFPGLDLARHEPPPLARSECSIEISFVQLCISLQIFSGLSGISIWRTPKGSGASITALTIAGVAPMVPASPAPLAPNGFTSVGVSVRSVSKRGHWCALGIA